MTAAPGWEEVPAVTLRACEARAVRWTSRRDPGWGSSVIQIERAVTADHAWLHVANLYAKEVSSENLIAELIGNGGGCELHLDDLIAFRQVLDETITAIRQERAGG